MKLKTIDYLKENKIEFYLCKICGEIVDKTISIHKNILKNLIMFVKLVLKNVLKMYF